MLAAAGIDTVEQLRQLGAVRAYVLARRAGGNVSLNLLWGIEGALTGEKWQVVAKTRRAGLLLEVEDVERQMSGVDR